MIVRRCFTPTTVLVVLTLLGEFDGNAAERWSRQVSNSEWIPLANPRAASGQVPQSNTGSGLLPSGTHLPNPIQSLALPPALQQQYQDQLIQLQKTQESIQKLLLLQQQLKAQQQILQSQTFLPSGFSNVEDEKQELPPSSLGNLQTTGELLVPPQVSSEALPPIYSAQNFLPHRPGHVHRPSHLDQNLEANRELSSLPVQGQVVLQHGEDVNVEDPREGPHSYMTKQGGYRPGGKRPKIQQNSELPQYPLVEGAGDEEEEVQLVYVPAETLAQKGQQPKRGRGRKPYHLHQQQRENQDGIEQAPLSADQEAFARQVLQQIQKEHEEKAQFLKAERVKEFTRLNEEQKALERKTRLQQEALQREQELLRQKEAEKKRKELERLEEMARQRELERIREAREKQRQEELERRRLAELRIKEEKRREEEARQREERQKQLNLEQVLKQQSILESQQEHNLQPTNPSLSQLQENGQSQARRQQLADGTRPKRIRGRQRQRINQYQEQPNYPEATTTPSPNQPPLSVYMGGPNSKLDTVRVTDVLRILKNAKTIDVLDNVGPNSPRVFVGPSNLDPPYGYAKFDLPYLSSIDHNRVERKVDKLPFFVAPLSFDPPPGYSKIPFPAPHIGSVVVNTLSETSPEPVTPPTEQNPSPTPLIEPNSYSEADQIAGFVATTASYDSPTTQSYSPESSGPKYESTYSTPASGSRFRFRQFYDNKPASVVSSSYYGEQSTTKTKPRTKQYYEQESKSTTQLPKVDTTASYRQEVSYSNAPNFNDRTTGSHDPSTKEQDLAAQLALINQELAQQREPQRYNTAEQYRPQANLAEVYDVNDVRAPVGPAQYNLPAELPPISPHLPGLVNSLLDKHEGNLLVTSTPPTTTTTPLTTTTTRVSSTTYRPRGRNRIVPTRARTTTTPSSRTNTDRTRRPYNRSKSRFSTTTEDYHESSYEPTKAKMPETTQKYKTTEYRRPTSRTHKYRSRDRTTSQSVIHDKNPNIQAHQAATYENYPTQSDSQSDLQANASPDAYSPTNEHAPNLQKEISSHGAVNDFTRESYMSTTPTQTENYPPLREVTVQQGAALVSNDYSSSQNYPQNRPQETHYHGGFEQLEKTPVNGFNYQVGNEESPDQAIPQRPNEYPRYQVKLEDANYNLASTEDPRIRSGEEQRYSPVYEVNVAQTQPQDYNTDGQNLIRDQILPSEDGKIESGVVKADPNVQPIFVPLQHSKQEDYELHIPPTQTPLVEIATTSTTTPAPVIIRQRVRGRLGGRGHHESSIQTRPRGSQDEYVRFSAVNHDSSRGTGHRPREGSRTRTRARPQSHGSQVQTEGNEYIKIHGAQQQKLIATTTLPTTTTVPTTSVHPLEEDIDYGFIRPPSFHPVHPVHLADNRFQAPITYRPPLSEIQHIISNDETAVESSPTHVLKNRPKYQQIPNRRPATKTFATTTTSTTTEAIPIETTMLDNTEYTVKPKARLEDSKTTRVRGRIRRPSKKRTTTTTTESTLEANNELPLDENYPRITSQQLATVTETGQQTFFEEDFEIPSQYVPSQNRPVQLYEETTSENYPPQEFILNFDNLPEQVSQREKYDQTQLASTSSKKYSHSSHVNPTEDVNVHSMGDIYGAESQWSTKLSKTSFQPSFASNRATDSAKRSRGKTRGDRNNENAPEIITAGPDLSFVTMVVSSDYQKRTDDIDDMDTVFGRKTNVPEHTEKLNATSAVTSSSITTFRGMIKKEEDASSQTRDWLSSKESNIAKQTDDFTQTTKKVTDPLPNKKGGTRRRRVRVRVRPAVDDFVTAESQHFNSAVNSLVQDRYKYNPIRESKFTTVQPIATTVTTSITTTAAPTTQKSLLQDFLEEVLKNDEVSVPTHVTTIPTDFPVWSTSTPITTTYSANNDETTTPKENTKDTAVVMTVTPSNPDPYEHTATSASLDEIKDESVQVTSLSPEQISQLSQEAVEDPAGVKSEEYRAENFQEDKVDQNDLENVGIITQRYKLPSNYPVGSETSRQVEDSTTVFPAARNKGKEHIMTLKRPEENVEENEAHPKNHKAKWSEVRYPSAFDKSQSALKQHSTTSIPGFITRNDGETSVKTLSDYVAAIFDSMKSVDGQGQEEEEEEIAKVVEAKNESPAEDSYRYNNIALVREISAIEKSGLRTVTTTDSSRDAHTTQHVDLEENATSLPEVQAVTDTTTKESATTLESTAPTPDATVNAITPPEDIMTMRISTSTEKTTTPLGADNVDRANSTITMLGKVLRTSTTTRVSHMTEICYRGRCVMTRPKMEDATR
ncbi:uncharacterized protein LOC116853938 [Odontomachus brunneus]|uniref:uncharacterized protein LOC116853938 n=1 Tax=Odontomachus brunneus TaxID=486640 RepID=UPI0013F182F6|nr:uncharacterized protein LOC116853938 [Odontomachus brunneus]